MEYSPFFNPLFIIPSGIVVVLDLLSFPIYFKWLKSGQIQKSKPIFFLKPFSIIICTYFLFTQSGAGEFLGGIYCLIAPLLAVYMFASFLVWIQREDKKSNSSTYPDKVLLLGVLLILSTAIPSFLSISVRNWCTNANSSKIAPIARTVEKYYAHMGRYPNDIDELVPDFISSIPVPSCGVLSAFPREFELIDCRGSPIVFVKAVDFTEYDLYHLKDDSISHVEYELYVCP